MSGLNLVLPKGQGQPDFMPHVYVLEIFEDLFPHVTRWKLLFKIFFHFM